tara:strand:- start:478 stop:3921 length:3444 start_codon:yes stop_codon:yes gene_type:complete
MKLISKRIRKVRVAMLLLGIVMFWALILGSFMIYDRNLGLDGNGFTGNVISRNVISESGRTLSNPLSALMGFVIESSSDELVVESFDKEIDLEIKNAPKLGELVVGDNKNERMDFGVEGRLRLYFDLLDYEKFVEEVGERLIAEGVVEEGEVVTSVVEDGLVSGNGGLDEGVVEGEVSDDELDGEVSDGEVSEEIVEEEEVNDNEIDVEVENEGLIEEDEIRDIKNDEDGEIESEIIEETGQEKVEDQEITDKNKIEKKEKKEKDDKKDKKGKETDKESEPAGITGRVVSATGRVLGIISYLTGNVVEGEVVEGNSLTFEDVDVDVVKANVVELSEESIDVIEDSSKIELEDEEFEIEMNEIGAREKNVNYKWDYRVELKDLNFMAKVDVTSDKEISVLNDYELVIGDSLLSFKDLVDSGYKVSIGNPFGGEKLISEEMGDEVVEKDEVEDEGDIGEVIEEDVELVEGEEDEVKEVGGEGLESLDNDNELESGGEEEESESGSREEEVGEIEEEAEEEGESSEKESETVQEESESTDPEDVGDTKTEGGEKEGKGKDEEKDKGKEEKDKKDKREKEEVKNEVEVEEEEIDVEGEVEPETKSTSEPEPEVKLKSEPEPAEESTTIAGNVINILFGLTRTLLGNVIGEIDIEPLGVEDLEYLNTVSVFIQRDFTDSEVLDEVSDVGEVGVEVVEVIGVDVKESVIENEILDEVIVEEEVDEGVIEEDEIDESGITGNVVDEGEEDKDIFEDEVDKEVEEETLDENIEDSEDNVGEIEDSIGELGDTEIVGDGNEGIEIIEEEIEEVIEESLKITLGKIPIPSMVIGEDYEDLDNNGVVSIGDILILDPTFIRISKAVHLDSNRSLINNIYEDVREKDGNFSEVINTSDYVRVTFERNLTRENDITIYARSSDNISRDIGVYAKDNDSEIARFENVLNESWHKIYLSNLNVNESYDVFDLRILLSGENGSSNESNNPITGGIEFDYIMDPSGNDFIINNKSDDIVATIDSSGAAFLHGKIYQSQTSFQTGYGSFIVTNKSDDIVTLINSTGDMLLFGNTYESVAIQTGYGFKLEFRNRTDDLVSYINNTGDFVLKGTITQSHTFSFLSFIKYFFDILVVFIIGVFMLVYRKDLKVINSSLISELLVYKEV